MALDNLLSFDEFVQLIATAQQAQSDKILDFTPGAVMLANAESSADVGVFMQSLFVQLLATTRAASSNGSDLDSFCGDFGLKRLPAFAATGNVTFSRYAATQQAIIYPQEATVQTADGSVDYVVTLDTANDAYDAGVGGYVVPVGTASVTVPVAATVAGTVGNVASGVITTISSPIPNIDTVTNSVAFTNGKGEENDPDFRARFVAYIQSLGKATKTAVSFAAKSIQQGATVSIVENQQIDGTYAPGFFYTSVDDGTGSPSSSLLDAICLAVDEVRPLTVNHTVVGPQVEHVAIAFTLSVAAGYDKAAVSAAASSIVTDYVNSLPLGAGLPYTKVSQLGYSASPGVTNVTDVTINGGTVGIDGVPGAVLKVSSVVVN